MGKKGWDDVGMRESAGDETNNVFSYVMSMLAASLKKFSLHWVASSWWEALRAFEDALSNSSSFRTPLQWNLSPIGKFLSQEFFLIDFLKEVRKRIHNLYQSIKSSCFRGGMYLIFPCWYIERRLGTRLSKVIAINIIKTNDSEMTPILLDSEYRLPTGISRSQTQGVQRCC
jgi:hypothetical protein